MAKDTRSFDFWLDGQAIQISPYTVDIGTWQDGMALSAAQVAQVTGTAAATATATGQAGATASATATAPGASTANGVGFTPLFSVGTAPGAATAQAATGAIARATSAAPGDSSAIGIASELIEEVGGVFIVDKPSRRFMLDAA